VALAERVCAKAGARTTRTDPFTPGGSPVIDTVIRPVETAYDTSAGLLSPSARVTLWLNGVGT
jgi:hypothetical protein